jgi:putative SOS response-associated peptidase YedK
MEKYRLKDAPQLDDRYNIAPQQPVAVVRTTEKGNELVLLKWGLIPSWSKDPTIAYKLINARSETVAEKPSFRSAFKSRRCLIPASGFYEWQKTGGRTKQPYFIRLRDEDLFSLAGLWERWHAPRGEIIETCTILTTEANEVMRPLHDRMPVILDAEGEDAWLDTRSTADVLRPLFVPFGSAEMEAYPVSSWVSNAKHEGPRCLEPA